MYYIIKSDIDNSNFMVNSDDFEYRTDLTILFEGSKGKAVQKLFEMEHRDKKFTITSEFRDLSSIAYKSRIETFEIMANSMEDAKKLAEGRWFEETRIITVINTNGN